MQLPTAKPCAIVLGGFIGGNLMLRLYRSVTTAHNLATNDGSTHIQDTVTNISFPHGATTLTHIHLIMGNIKTLISAVLNSFYNFYSCVLQQISIMINTFLAWLLLCPFCQML